MGDLLVHKLILKIEGNPFRENTPIPKVQTAYKESTALA